MIFWVVAPCNVAVGYQRFGEPCCLHLQSYQKTMNHRIIIGEGRERSGSIGFYWDAATKGGLSGVLLQQNSISLFVLQNSSDFGLQTTLTFYVMLVTQKFLFVFVSVHFVQSSRTESIQIRSWTTSAFHMFHLLKFGNTVSGGIVSTHC